MGDVDDVGSPNPHEHRRPVRHDTHDWSTVSPVEAVVETLSQVTGVPATEAPPLYESVDAEALEALVRSGVASSLAVSFHYSDYAVTVTGSGDVYVFET